MRIEGLKKKGLLFVVYLCCSLSGAGGGCQESVTPLTELDVVVPIKDGGGLAALVKSANSSRSTILMGDFDYKVLSDEIAKVYNGSSSTYSVLASTVFSYCRSALIIGGFVTLVSVIFPVMIIVLWAVRRYCCEENEDEDEDNRNLTIKAQINAWTLGILLIIVVAILTAFLVLLLIGNTWVSEGTSEGASFLNGTLPLLVKLKSDTLSLVQDILTSQYDTQVSSIIAQTSSVPVSVKQKLSDLYGPHIAAVVNDVQNELTGIQNLSHAASQLNVLHRGLLQLNLLPSLTNLTSAMLALCVNLTINTPLFVPMASQLLRSNFSSLGGVDPPTGSRMLSLLVATLGSITYVPVSSGFPRYLDDVGRTITEHINVTSTAYFGTIRGNLTQFASMLEGDYGNLNFGWPSSQSRLQLYLGSRYLDNWRVFISSSIIVFSAAVFGFIVCLFVAMARGLVNILLIYRYGDDMSYIEAAHQSGIFMRKLSCVFSIIPLIAAIISTAALCTAGVAGNICGPYANLTGLVDNVFDNPATWNNTYPLGAIFVNNPHYPFTVKGLLEGCHANQSLYVALRQNLRYNVGTSVAIPDQLAIAYVDNMKSVLLGNNFTVLKPEVQAQLSLAATNLSNYQVSWDDYMLLDGSELWLDQRFGGIDALGAFLALFESNNTLQTYTRAALSALSSFKTCLAMYQRLQERYTGDTASNLSTVAVDAMAEVSIDTASISNTLLTQAAIQANQMLYSYETTARSQLQCGLGTCSSLPSLFSSFSSAVCGDVVQGMDVLWTSLLATLSFSLLALLLTVALAGRLIDVQLEKSLRNKLTRFDIANTAIEQLSSTLWLLIGVAVSAWFVAVVFEGQGVYGEGGCGLGCCYACVEAFGAVFLGLSALTGGGSHMYQGIILYRLRELESSNVGVKARRFWLERKKAVHFYGQLCQFFLQDIPFLVLAGYFTQQTKALHVSAFFTLSVSLLGVVAYFGYLVVERGNIQGYFGCLKGEALDAWTKFRIGGGVVRPPAQEPSPATSSLPQRPHRSPYGSSESEHSDDSQGTYQEENGFEYVRTTRNQQRLSDIQEEQHEGMSVLDQVTSDDPGAGDPEGHSNHHEEHASTQFRQRNPFNTVTLDHAVDPENGDLLRRRQEAIMLQEMGGGVDVADPYYRQTDAESSTTRSGSYYGSSNSITASEVPGYSSSHAPDEIEMSDQRDDYDYDSEYSQHRSVLHIRGLTTEMSVEV
ncbi:hypothetical protein EMCRGX_G033076 [Ephydatia muelleri]